MSNQRQVFLILALLFGINGNAQFDTLICNLDENYQLTTNTNSFYIGKYKITSDGVYLQTHRRMDDKLLMKGWYKDPTFKTEHGKFTFFGDNENIILEGNFNNGTQMGWWVEWDNDHQPSDSVYFDSGKQAEEINLYYHADGIIRMRKQTFPLLKKQFVRQYFPNGLLQFSSVKIDNSIIDTSYYPNGNIRTIINSENRKIKKGQYFTPEGEQISEKKFKANEKKKSEVLFEELKAEMEKFKPEFPGGESALRTYINRNIQIPASAKTNPVLIEKITISFSLDKDGRAVNITVLNVPDTELNSAVADAFKNMPAWDMKGLKRFGPINFSINLL